MTIDEATAGDEAAVVAVWRASGLVAAGNDPVADFRSALARTNATVLVARSGAEVAGAAMAGEDGHRGWLYYVGVAPGNRRSGIGGELVRAAETWLRARGMRRINLMIREGNAAVAAFYAALGYELTPRTVMQKRFD